MLGSKEIDINNTDIYDMDKDLYLRGKECEEKLLQGIQSVNGFKAMVKAKKTDGMVITVTTKENTIKKTFGKRFAIPLNSDFFKRPVYPYGLKEDLILRLELNSSEKVILCIGSLEYDTIFDEPYAIYKGNINPLPDTLKKTLLGRLALTCQFVHYVAYCYYF